MFVGPPATEACPRYTGLEVEGVGPSAGTSLGSVGAPSPGAGVAQSGGV